MWAFKGVANVVSKTWGIPQTSVTPSMTPSMSHPVSPTVAPVDQPLDPNLNLELPPLPACSVPSQVHSKKEWTQLKRNLSTLGHTDVDALAASYRTYLTLPTCDAPLYRRIEGYVHEYQMTGEVSSSDSYTLLALLKHVSTGKGLPYLTKALKTCWTACFVHLPNLHEMTRARSLALFKTMLHLFYFEAIDLDRGIQQVLTRSPLMVSGLTLYRGIKKTNVAMIEHLTQGDSFVFPIPMSTSLSPSIAHTFTEKEGEQAILVFQFGNLRAFDPSPQHVPGMVISASFGEESSEYEVFLLGGLECRFVHQTVIHGARHYVFDVMSRRTFMDPHLFFSSVRKITLGDLVHPVVYSRPNTFDPETSRQFIEEHFPPNRPLRHLIDHVMTIDPSIDLSPTHIIRRITRDRTLYETNQSMNRPIKRFRS